jgi:hypothetical protein
MTTESTPNTQWLFPISALSCTPTSQERSLHEEMYDRSRGIEFLYRLGTSIGLFVRRVALPFPSRYSTLVSPHSAIPRAYSRLRRGFIASLCGILCLIIIDKLVSSLCCQPALRSWPPLSSLIRHQTIAAACVFLATKTEECGRKLRDVARVCQSKAKGIDVREIPESGPVRFFRYLSRYMLEGSTFFLFFFSGN